MRTHSGYMLQALRLARRGYGATSPNPMVGAVLVKHGKVIGRGWHRRAGEPHAEIEALTDAARRGNATRGATLYVTLEPCCTHGRTPPCTEAVIAAGIRRVVIGATDPNPRHHGRAFTILKRAHIQVTQGVLGEKCRRLNESFNHWIVARTPFVTVKAAMTLDGKIATAKGESKWITGEKARALGMKLRQEADAILVGINTILADNPSLTFRRGTARATSQGPGRLRRIVLDSLARTPINSRVVSDRQRQLTTIIVGRTAPSGRVEKLARRVKVLVAPVKIQASGLRASASRALGTSARAAKAPVLDLKWILKRLGAEEVTSLLIEGGGEVNASFLLGGFAQRVVFFYAPKILGGHASRRAVAGGGARSIRELLRLTDVRWRRVGEDWLLTARVS